MNQSGAQSLRALILAPTGRDASLTVSLLKEAGCDSDICSDLNAMVREMNSGAGLAILADEALQDADLRPLLRFLEEQAPWSDLPVILLTYRGGGGPERNPAALRLGEILGNVSFLERPFHPATLRSMVHSAMRARRRQYEARARLLEISEREQQLKTALTAGSLGSWTLDVERKIVHPSETSSGHFGVLSAGDFSYDDWLRAAHPDDVERITAAFEHSAQTGADLSLEYRNIRGAQVHWVDVRARALRNPRGAVGSLAGVSSDITARKNSELERERLLGELAQERSALSDLTRTLEQRVSQRTTELMAEVAAREKAQEQLLQSQKMESVGQLTGGIAHDFNNLLMAVMGNLEMLRKRLPNEPGLSRLIEGAMQGAQRGASLTQRMLAFARQQDLRTASADIGALVTGMQDLLRRSLGPQIALNLFIGENLPPAEVDPHQVELAVLNLAINARDAMPEGGVIDIRVDHVQIDRADRLRPGTYLRIQISDTGCGMDMATLNRAIEPFFSTKPVGKGTGLGLSMTHGLAVQLGGHLELASQVGKGTVATLWLPRADTPAVQIEAPPTLAMPLAVRSHRILVVDDDPLVAMSTVEMLEDLGHVVLEANSGKRALEIIDAGHALDLMMTDQAMPGMTGIQLAEIVRSKRPNLPVLLATGYTDLPASKLANLPRLSKPYQQAQLQAEIDKLLDPAA